MKWNPLTDMAQLDVIDRDSATQKILLFKHSTRCSTSSMALARMERNWKEENEKVITPYFLDLLAHRNVSNAIAERYGIQHQSPQVLVIDKGRCVYTQSHLGISVQDIMEI